MDCISDCRRGGSFYNATTDRIVLSGPSGDSVSLCEAASDGSSCSTWSTISVGRDVDSNARVELAPWKGGYLVTYLGKDDRKPYAVEVNSSGALIQQMELPIHPERVEVLADGTLVAVTSSSGHNGWSLYYFDSNLSQTNKLDFPEFRTASPYEMVLASEGTRLLAGYAEQSAADVTTAYFYVVEGTRTLNTFEVLTSVAGGPGSDLAVASGAGRFLACWSGAAGCVLFDSTSGALRSPILHGLIPPGAMHLQARYDDCQFLVGSAAFDYYLTRINPTTGAGEWESRGPFITVERLRSFVRDDLFLAGDSLTLLMHGQERQSVLSMGCP